MRILLYLVPLAGCAGGAMRQATLVGQCAADDVACSRRTPMAPLAIGTRFYPDISTEIAGTTTPTLMLHSADPSVLGIEDGALLAKQAGASAVMIATDDGTVIDFIHVWVAPITKITLARRDGERIESAIGLTVGEDVTVVPTLWNGAQRLAGSTDATWTVDADGALAVLRDGSADRRRLRARAPGKATITVALGDAKASFDVEVIP